MPTCKVCGRELTSPASILNEIGATCFRKLRLQRAKDYFIANQLSLFDCVVKTVEPVQQRHVQVKDVRNDLEHSKQLADDGKQYAVYQDFNGYYIVGSAGAKTSAEKVYETAG